jgi:elongation of very long chain fatty acids protein 6
MFEALQTIRKDSEFVEAYDFEVYNVFEVISALPNYRPVMFASIGFYLLAVYLGQKWMKNRPPHKLNTALFLWNSGLCIFSIIAALRGAPEFLFLMSKPDGVYQVTCNTLTHNYATSFWATMFLFSKFFEFGDTAFIVLRKQKLIVLHWFHHSVTVLMWWIGSEYYDSFGRLFVVNAFVHSLMYAYYALRALKISVPRKLSMMLTTVQILQLAFGIYANYVSIAAMRQGIPCGRDWNFIYLAGAVILTFLILFINFYVKTYLFRNKSKVQ